MKLVEPNDKFMHLTLSEIEQQAIELGLPAMIMCLCVEKAHEKDGWELRLDVLDKLGKSVAAPLAGFDMMSVSRLGSRINEHAEALLHEVSPDEVVDGIHIAAMFVVVLIGEGLFEDHHAVVVTTSLLLLDDLKEGGNWPYKERWLQTEAKRLLALARARGLYKTQVVQSLPGHKRRDHESIAK